jgi:hypothetical protein
MKSTLTINQVPAPDKAANLTDDQIAVVLATISLMAQVGVKVPYIINCRTSMMLDRLTDIRPEHIAVFRKNLDKGHRVVEIVSIYAEAAIASVAPEIVSDVQNHENLCETMLNAPSTVN